MKLSASLALTLLASQNLSGASAAWSRRADTLASSAASVRALQRMLAKKEQGAKTKNGNDNGKKSTGGGGGNGKKPTGGGGSNKSTGGKGHGKGGRGGNKEHSAHLDTNNNGITVNATEYTYGTPIIANFELTNDLIAADVLATMNVDNMDEWTMGLYMRMADPQGGALSPILSITPTIDDAGVRRMLQDTDVTTTTTTEPTMPAEPAAPPTLNLVGSATFSPTDAVTLNSNKYGTGFDIFLLDENGRAIIGPATLYMLPTQAMQDEEEANKGKVPNYGLVKFDHSKKKGKAGKANSGDGKGDSGGKGGGEKDKGMGYGSGKDGGMILSTAESLATYRLDTDYMDYALGNDVKVTYDIKPVVIEEAKRRMLKKRGNGGGKGGGNGKDTATTTKATDAPGTTTDASGTTTDAPDATTTTSTTTSDFDLGAGDGPDGDLGDGLEAQPTVDLTDITLFSMGVYMRMAHPQEGALPPILSIPLCAEDPCTKTAEELESGDVTFNTNDLDVADNGSGFDVWILNGGGGGIAGPYTFYINLPRLG